MLDLEASKFNVKNDIPAKISKKFANELGKPVADLINTAIKQGSWPDIFKLEVRY